MSYTCDFCNYSTNDSGNFSRHKKTEKHKKIYIEKYTSNKKVQGNNQIISNDIKKDSKILCEYCNMEFTYKANLSRHKLSCNIKKKEQININELKLKLEYSEKEKELYKKLEKEKSEMLKEKTELLTNFMNNANILLNKTTDNTKITAQAMQNVSMSAIKYANDKFKDTPALLPLNNFNINDLDFDDEKDKEKLIEILIYNAKQKSLDKLLGDHIIKCYKTNNPADQPFHTTDCSRLNYIVRELIENALSWSVDKNGIKICSSIIIPLIEKCIETLLDYQKILLDEMESGNYKSKEKVQIIISVLISIDKGSLENDINKYIAPFFNLNKSQS